MGTAGLALILALYYRYSSSTVPSVVLQLPSFSNNDWLSILPAIGEGFFGTLPSNQLPFSIRHPPPRSSLQPCKPSVFKRSVYDCVDVHERSAQVALDCHLPLRVPILLPLPDCSCYLFVGTILMLFIASIVNNNNNKTCTVLFIHFTSFTHTIHFPISLFLKGISFIPPPPPFLSLDNCWVMAQAEKQGLVGLPSDLVRSIAKIYEGKELLAAPVDHKGWVRFQNDLREVGKTKSWSSQLVQRVIEDYGMMEADTFEDGFERLMNAALGGSAEEQFVMGCLSLDGCGIAQDFERGKMWMAIAASQGSHPALISLGFCYGEGIGMEPDARKAVVLYQTAAKKGFTPAYYHLAQLYENGIWVDPDDKAALKWYRKGASAGHMKAQHMLAWYHVKGWGRRRNIKRAAELFHEAALAGEVNCMYDLGRMYHKGVGLPQDMGKAMTWFQEADKLKHEDAPAAIFKCVLQLILSLLC